MHSSSISQSPKWSVMSIADNRIVPICCPNPDGWRQQADYSSSTRSSTCWRIFNMMHCGGAYRVKHRPHPQNKHVAAWHSQCDIKTSPLHSWHRWEEIQHVVSYADKGESNWKSNRDFRRDSISGISPKKLEPYTQNKRAHGRHTTVIISSKQ